MFNVQCTVSEKQTTHGNYASDKLENLVRKSIIDTWKKKKRTFVPFCELEKKKKTFVPSDIVGVHKRFFASRSRHIHAMLLKFFI